MGYIFLNGRNFLFSIIFLSFTFLWSQNEHKIWYFGEQAGLDFNTTPPTVLTNSAMIAPEGCSSIANENGELLFYTNGVTIYNRSHQIMDNGNGLSGDVNSSQASLIVGLPDSDTEYYVFTTDKNGDTNGLQYHVVDMTANGGLGVVTLKNQLLQSPVSEKLTATLDTTGNNTWIVAHGIGNNSFYSYLLTPAGLNLVPVVSNVGPDIQAGLALNNFRGNMKIAPNGEFLCYASGGDSTLNLFRFDNATGVVSDHLDITNFPTQPFKETTNKFYGVEFSPSARYLYMAGSFINASGVGVESQVWQFNISDYDEGLIEFRAAFLSPGFSGEIGGMQLAPDGKIYVAHLNRPFLSVIEDPEFAGGATTLNINAVSLNGRNSTLGLPNFTDINIKVDMFADGFCTNQVTDFQVTSNYDIQSQLWDFGDGITSTVPNPNHVYGIPGNYTVAVTIQTLVGSATGTLEITVHETPEAYKPTNFVECSTEQFVEFDLSEKIPEILNGQSSDDLGVSFHATQFDADFDAFPLPGLYTNQALKETIYVRVFNEENPECFDTTEFDIEVQLAPVLNEVNDLVLCDEDSDGMVSLDLTQFNAEILNGQDNTIFEVLYFENESDAENNVNPIPTNYTNTNPVEEISFRISNRTSPECFELGSFTISVFLAAVIDQLEPIVVCDEDDDGVLEFQLGAYDALVLNGQNPNDFSVNYYVSQSNAEAANNALDKTAYTNDTPFQQKVYVRIQNQNIDDCYAISSFDLIINSLPNPDLEQTYVICPGNEELVLDGGDFDFWEWLDENGTVLGTERFFTIQAIGDYALNVIQTNDGVECFNTIDFKVLSSGAPESLTIINNGFSNIIDVEVEVTGFGDFEYSIDGATFQSSSAFRLSPGKYTVFVRDKLQCSTISEEVFLVGYPAFFSPNGDGHNETWNLVVDSQFAGGQIEIYDRYGKLLKQLSVNDTGWDGNYLDNQLPASDYWFRYLDSNGNTANGHFALVR